MAFYKQQSLQFCLTSGWGTKEKGFYCVSPGCGEGAGQIQQMLVKQKWLGRPGQSGQFMVLCLCDLCLPETESLQDLI